MAAQRHAHAVGADDVVFTSLEGQLLEGPTSTVVWAAGGTLHTPPLETGILAGTTMARLFARAADDGWPTSVTPERSPTCTPPTRSGCSPASGGRPPCTRWTGSRAATPGSSARVRELLAR